MRVKTLNELAHLRDSGFGQPYPRHGLSLLWWFANECVYIGGDGRMIARCDPKNKYFGFHPFHNLDELLPYTSLPYYDVGNLHHPGALPLYVTKYYHGNADNSNIDRIVVSVASDWNNKWFDRIYVTQHLNQKAFNETCTYRISQGLIRIIQSLQLSDFIRQVSEYTDTPSRKCDCSCTIL
uniref:Uncharacterized protein n=1 Tax=Cyprinus carpio TaxID=7962 RepID=A0A8C1WGE5_CYPCA